MKKRYAGLIAALLILAMAVPCFAARKTRDLVFEDDDSAVAEEKAKGSEIKDPETIMVRTTLDLTRDGVTKQVLPTHQFRSGDKVKLRYTTSEDGYVYWLAKMSSGKYDLLFPTPKTGMDNRISRNQEYTVPVKGSFRFDDTPGTESLLLVFGLAKIPELEAAVTEVAKTQGVSREGSSRVASVEEKNKSKRRSRDLVFEDEDSDDINTKSQVAPKGEPFVGLYELNHK